MLHSGGAGRPVAKYDSHVAICGLPAGKYGVCHVMGLSYRARGAAHAASRPPLQYSP